MNNVLGLYEHNLDSFEKIKNSFDEGNNVVGIVHATGTGKSYNALELAYENKDKKILYVVPSNGIIEHVKKIIDDNPNVDLEREFPNLEFRTYQSFINLSYEEISEIDCDLLILDEFHHLGAPVWGARINTLIETHQDMKVFGMTAYTVRDRGTSYERDMALEEADELFSGNIVSRYDLCDAMIDGILPKPIYKSTHINLLEMERDLEERVNKLNVESKEYKEYIEILNDVKRRINDAPSIPSILKKNVKPNGKYIYFCPPISQDGANDIETIKKQALEWFKQFVPEEDIVIYTSTSEMRELGVKNRDAFYKDVTLDGEKVNNKLRVMFAINQYNEGIHAPNIDGVIMGRGTSSDIVYFEQLGRALSVRGNTKEKFQEYEILSKEDLINLCFSRDILIDDSLSKEEIIEKLIAPVVIDLTDNYSFIKELENNLRDRIKEVKENGLGNKREIKLSDATFDVEIENHDLYEMLLSLRNRLQLSWMDYYELAKKYYEHHGDLLIPQKFKTINGYEYDENGFKLGDWLVAQKQKIDLLSFERKEMLNQIGFVQNVFEFKWMLMYQLAKQYYEHYKNLMIPTIFRTINGYDYDEKGIRLGSWLNFQRKNYNGMSEERKKLLKKIDFTLNANEAKWQKMYDLAKQYYNHYGNLAIPHSFKTLNGYEYDEDGVKIGYWFHAQKTNYARLSIERKKLLDSLGFSFESNEDRWQKMFKLTKTYYEHYDNFLIPSNFKTINGYEYDENGLNLGAWVGTQRNKYNTLSPERKKKLDDIGFVLNGVEARWSEMFRLSKVYYEHYGDLFIPYKFKTVNGFEYDDDGVRLGYWMHTQKQFYDNLPNNKKELLKSIGFVVNYYDGRWQRMYDLAEIYFHHYNNLLIVRSFKTINGYEYDENGLNLGAWIGRQKVKYDSLSEEQKKMLKEIGFVHNVYEARWLEMYSLAKKYYEYHKDLLIPFNFKTKNGFEWDDKGANLGNWITTQKSYSDSLTEEQKGMLEKIGFVKSLNDSKWQKMYELAKAYFIHYNNLYVDSNFKTTNGYEFDEDGVSLGIWIANQRKLIEHGSERVRLLTNIGMIWSIRSNSKEVMEICNRYNIDYNKNKLVLKNISVEVLQSKIKFLLANNMCLVNSDGKLDKIFSISSVDMKERFGVTLEELINEYYKDKERGM